MKWMIASDLHGSAYYCRKMLEAFEREGADRLFLLGDLLYHGPRNDLPREYAPKEVIPLLNGKKEKLLLPDMWILLSIYQKILCEKKNLCLKGCSAKG